MSLAIPGTLHPRLIVLAILAPSALATRCLNTSLLRSLSRSIHTRERSYSQRVDRLPCTRQIETLKIKRPKFLCRKDALRRPRVTGVRERISADIDAILAAEYCPSVVLCRSGQCDVDHVLDWVAQGAFDTCSVERVSECSSNKVFPRKRMQ